MKIIATLTSFPLRATTIHRVIETILNQSAQPDKVILYLAEEQFPGRELPLTLTALAEKEHRFEIHWCQKDIKSYKKLIPALIEFPDDIIITFDDDILYPSDIIEELIKKHRKYPNAICTRRARLIKVKDGEIGVYETWKRYKWYRRLRYGTWPKFRNLATTGGGTLFPPHSLHPDVVRDDIFMNMCPTTDDLWFFAMAVLNGTKTAPAGKAYKIDIIEETQGEALMHDNVKGQCRNDRNMEKILKEYPLVKSRITEPISFFDRFRKSRSR